jgi:hypothetical protein
MSGAKQLGEIIRRKIGGVAAAGFRVNPAPRRLPGDSPGGRGRRIRALGVGRYYGKA